MPFLALSATCWRRGAWSLWAPPSPLPARLQRLQRMQHRVPCIRRRAGGGRSVLWYLMVPSRHAPFLVPGAQTHRESLERIRTDRSTRGLFPGRCCSASQSHSPVAHSRQHSKTHRKAQMQDAERALPCPLQSPHLASVKRLAALVRTGNARPPSGKSRSLAVPSEPEPRPMSDGRYHGVGEQSIFISASRFSNLVILSLIDQPTSLIGTPHRAPAKGRQQTADRAPWVGMEDEARLALWFLQRAGGPGTHRSTKKLRSGVGGRRRRGAGGGQALFCRTGIGWLRTNAEQASSAHASWLAWLEPGWLAAPLAAAGPVVALISLWVFFSVWPPDWLGTTKQKEEQKTCESQKTRG